jgi:fructose-1,6-bisphosphatase/inositol monophosphatase family enzyme
MRKCAGFTSTGGIAWKGDSGSIDPVTETDQENELLVQRAIATAFPSHEMIGEESSAAMGQIPGLTDARTWIVDPIDGTANFVHGNTNSCVSIGQCEGKVPRLGVVYGWRRARRVHSLRARATSRRRPLELRRRCHVACLAAFFRLPRGADPYLDELYVAVRGQGAFCNGRPIRVHSPQPAYDRALILTEPGYERSPEGIAKILATTKALLEANVQAIRINGSAVLSIMWVANGRANAYFAGLHDKDCAKPWDWCAAYVIATEAGASFARIDARSYPGGPGTGSDSAFDIYSKSIVCTCSAQMTADVRALIHKAYKDNGIDQ